MECIFSSKTLHKRARAWYVSNKEVIRQAIVLLAVIGAMGSVPLLGV
jgi:hypothetical protein